MKAKKTFLVVTITLSLFFLNIVSEARVWDWKILEKEGLVPYEKIDAKSQQKIGCILNTVPVLTTLFTTSTPPREVISFYKERMVKNGWALRYPVEGKGLEWLKENRPDIIGKLHHAILNSPRVAGLVLDKEKITYRIGAVKESNMERTGVCIRREAGEVDFGDATRDAPGRDLKDIPRYPGAIRRVCLEHAAGTLTLIYESRTPLPAIMRFYKRRLSAKGWEITSFSQNKGIDLDNLLFFGNARREGGMLSVSHDEESASSQILILYGKRDP